MCCCQVAPLFPNYENTREWNVGNIVPLSLGEGDGGAAAAMEFLSLLKLPSAQVLLLWACSISFLCYLMHQWTTSLHLLLRIMLGVFTGIALVFLCHLSYWRRQRIYKFKGAVVQELARLTKNDLLRLLPEHAALSASTKRPDQFGWLNFKLATVWPFLNEAISNMVKDNLQSLLDEYKMGVLVEMRLVDLSFGLANPRFIAVRMLEMKEDETSVEVDVDWKAEKESIVVKVKTIGPDFKVKVHNIYVSGTLKIVLKPLADTLPCFGAVVVSLSNIPAVHFDLKIAEGNINALPGVEKMIDASLRSALEDSLVWPNRVVCPVLPGDYSFLMLKTVGILDVTLVKATDVMNTDLLGKSDCFTLLFVRKKPDLIKRSTTKKNSLHPIWNEGFKIEVQDHESQKLTVQLMDEESLTNAEFIGHAMVPLNDLLPHKPKEIWLDMRENEKVQSRSIRARVQIILVYEPFER